MTTLGTLGGLMNTVKKGLTLGGSQNTYVQPPGTGQAGAAADNPQLSTTPIQQPDTTLEDMLASFGGGGTGSSGRAGSSDPRLNDLALQQNRVALWDQYVTGQNDFAILANQLQNKQQYVNENYQTQLGNLLHQYGSNVAATEQAYGYNTANINQAYNTNLFNVNAGSAAAGSYGSMGANQQRSDLLSSKTRDLGNLSQTEQRTLADLLYGKTSGQTQLQNILNYQTSNITDAEKKAYNDQLARIFSINQAQQYNDLAMQIAGI